MAPGNERRSLWQVETEMYVPRIGKAMDRLAPALAECRKLPTPPFSHEPSLEEQLVYSIALFAQSGATVADQLIDNIGLLWSQGRMVGVSGLTRFAVEYWAAVYFGRNILTNYMADKNLEEAVRKGARLTFSAKTPIRLWWGGESANPAYSVMTFIDRLSAVRPDIKARHDFLSEASHPNFVQNTYFVMASRALVLYRPGDRHIPNRNIRDLSREKHLRGIERRECDNGDRCRTGGADAGEPQCDRAAVPR
jgi:hypothetical protein